MRFHRGLRSTVSRRLNFSGLPLKSGRKITEDGVSGQDGKFSLWWEVVRRRMEARRSGHSSGGRANTKRARQVRSMFRLPSGAGAFTETPSGGTDPETPSGGTGKPAEPSGKVGLVQATFGWLERNGGGATDGGDGDWATNTCSQVGGDQTFGTSLEMRCSIEVSLLRKAGVSSESPVDREDTARQENLRADRSGGTLPREWSLVKQRRFGGRRAAQRTRDISSESFRARREVRKPDGRMRLGLGKRRSFTNVTGNGIRSRMKFSARSAGPPLGSGDLDRQGNLTKRDFANGWRKRRSRWDRMHAGCTRVHSGGRLGNEAWA